MKIALVVHGYPPELAGGTEHSVRALAHGLVRAGDEPVIIAGSDDWQEGFRVTESRDAGPGGGESVRVWRIHRADLHYAHWQKGRCDRTGEAYVKLLERERPDVVHVHHWARLTRDLVARAVGLGIPAVLTLHDYSTSCLIHHRVPRDDARWCDRLLGSNPCLECASRVHGATAWIDRPEQERLLRGFASDLRRELELASTVLALTDDQAETLSELLRASGILSDAAQRIRVEPLAVGEGALNRSTRTFTDPPLRLGCWGSLSWHKGTDVLIAAVRRVVERRGVGSIELHLAGVEAPSDLERFGDVSRGLPIRLHGPFPDGGLADHPVADVHAFVTGTRSRETWSVVVDEAMALGLPLILPRFGALTERLGDDGALFYGRGDAEDLADVLEEVMLDPERLVSARACSVQKWSGAITVETHTRRLQDIYADAVRRGPVAVPQVGVRMDGPGSEAWMRDWDEMLTRSGFVR